MPREHREFAVDATGYRGEEPEEAEEGPGLYLVAFIAGVITGLLLGLLILHSLV